MEKTYFECPYCGRKLSVECKLFPVDTKLKCKKCKGVFAFMTKRIVNPFKDIDITELTDSILLQPIDND